MTWTLRRGGGNVQLWADGGETRVPVITILPTGKLRRETVHPKLAAELGLPLTDTNKVAFACTDE